MHVDTAEGCSEPFLPCYSVSTSPLPRVCEPQQALHPALVPQLAWPGLWKDPCISFWFNTKREHLIFWGNISLKDACQWQSWGWHLVLWDSGARGKEGGAFFPRSVCFLPPGLLQGNTGGSFGWRGLGGLPPTKARGSVQGQGRRRRGVLMGRVCACEGDGVECWSGVSKSRWLCISL